MPEKSEKPQESAVCPFCQARGPVERLAAHIQKCPKNPGATQTAASSPATAPVPKELPRFPFIDFRLLQSVGGFMHGKVVSMRKGSGKFGEGWNLDILCGKAMYTKSVKQDSANHKRLHSAFGPNWVGADVQMRYGNPNAGEKEQVVIEAYGTEAPKETATETPTTF